jgi:hypothetical protein
MNIAIYCGKWILPAKNGTRYLDKIFPTNGKVQGNSNDLLVNTLKDKCVIQSNELYMLAKTEVTHLFIREPLTQLQSALYTDCWGHITSEEKKLGLSKNNNKIKNLLNEYITTGTGHWCSDLYQSLYWLLKAKPDIKVLPLSELTSFMESMGYYETYIPEDYNFKNLTGDDINLNVVNINRNELLKWIEENYPNHINKIIKLLMVEISYYNKIINKDYGPELSKIKRLPIKKLKHFSYSKMTNEDYGGMLSKIKKLILKHTNKAFVKHKSLI